MKKIFKNGIIFLFFAIVCFCFSFYLNLNKIKIPYFEKLDKNVQVDVIFKNNPPKIFYNDVEQTKYLKINDKHYLFSNDKLNQSVSKISFVNKEQIEKLIIFVGNEAKFIDKNTNEVNLNNSKTFIDKFSISFLSFFYNFNFYILSYIFLFLFLINFKGKINHKITFCLILFLGLIFRISQINAIPFWDDEIYSLTCTSKFAPISALFNDAGNPPLYYIFLKIYRSFIQNPNFYRFSSVIIGLIFNVIFYFYIKQIFGKNKALFGFFIATINILLIYLSQELRCYMLLMLLSVLNSIYLFKFNKNKKLYSISAIAITYTHFYGVFFVLYNFIFGLSIFKKNIKKLKSFCISNLIIFLAFLPILLYKISSLTNNFNSWLKTPIILDYLETIKIFTCPFLFVLILIPLLIYIYQKSNKKNKLMIRYNLFAIFSIFIFASIFSYLIKPIFFYKYFYVVYPCYLALLVFVFTYKFKYKIFYLIQMFLFVLLLTNSKISLQNLFCNHNIFFDFIKNDINYTKNNYIFISDTLKNSDINFKKAKVIYLPINNGINDIDLEKYSKNNAIFYVQNLYLTKNVIQNAKNIELHKSPLGIFAKVTY